MSVAPAQLAAVQAPGSSCESARKSPSRSHPGGLRDDCAQMWASAASKVPISGQAAHTGVYPRRLFRETGGGNGEPAAGKKAGKPGPVAPAGSKEDGKCRKLLLLSVLRLR